MTVEEIRLTPEQKKSVRNTAQALHVLGVDDARWMWMVINGHSFDIDPRSVVSDGNALSTELAVCIELGLLTFFGMHAGTIAVVAGPNIAPAINAHPEHFFRNSSLRSGAENDSQLPN